jgi:hypothetical protein
MPFLPPPPIISNAPTCVRCGHIGAFHHSPRGCIGRLGWQHLWGHCRCQGYVPPGASPEVIDQEPTLRPTT